MTWQSHIYIVIDLMCFIMVNNDDKKNPNSCAGTSSKFLFPRLFSPVAPLRAGLSRSEPGSRGIRVE